MGTHKHSSVHFQSTAPVLLALLPHAFTPFPVHTILAIVLPFRKKLSLALATTTMTAWKKLHDKGIESKHARGGSSQV